MARKQLTQIFPFLLPLRQKQRKLFYYTAMQFDENNYAKDTNRGVPFTHHVHTIRSEIINPDTGCDIKYQENKYYNLELASNELQQLLIRPGETFSFWNALRYADKYMPYKDGLVLVNGKMQTEYGGGLCQLSGMLYELFMHSPLTVIERHNHPTKSFALQTESQLEAMDATVSEGWLDLKVKNETDMTFELSVEFSDNIIAINLHADTYQPFQYKVENEELTPFTKDGVPMQHTVVIVKKIDKQTQAWSEIKRVVVDYKIAQNLVESEETQNV